MTPSLRQTIAALALVAGGTVGGVAGVTALENYSAPHAAGISPSGVPYCAPNGRPEMVAEARDAGWCK